MLGKFPLGQNGIFLLAESVNPGISAAEMEASCTTLEKIASSMNADCVPLRKRKLGDGLVAEYLLRFKPDDTDFMEIR